MQLPDIGQLLATADPLVILVAVIIGVLVFFLLRFLVRSFHFVIQLGCLAIVILGVLYLIRSVIK